MKLIIAIINNDDCPAVLSELTRDGFSVTKLSTSGGFLKAGNSTLLIGVEEDKIDSALDVIKRFSSRRTQMIQASPSYPAEFYVSMPVEVKVGGATIFIVDVDQFIKY
ncbi:MAG: transcriptional regulator [Clostridiales bacterium]|nr:transcriptional regulator [Clostridiales bacterium]